MYHETETQPLAHCFLASERESVVNHRYIRIECIYLEFLTNGLASWTANLPFKVLYNCNSTISTRKVNRFFHYSRNDEA